MPTASPEVPMDDLLVDLLAAVLVSVVQALVVRVSRSVLAERG